MHHLGFVASTSNLSNVYSEEDEGVEPEEQRHSPDALHLPAVLLAASSKRKGRSSKHAGINAVTENRCYVQAFQGFINMSCLI